MIAVATHENATKGGIPACINKFTGNINGDSCIDSLVSNKVALMIIKHPVSSQAAYLVI
jgi:hypothetical protein